MRHIAFALLALVGAGEAFAQQTDVIPPRFQALAKNERFKLTRILGTPELHPAFNPTTAFSADGKRALYVEDLSSGAEDKPMFRTRLVVWDVAARSWPREIDIDGRNVTALDLAPDGKTLLLAGLTFPEKAKDYGPYLALWDLDKGTEVRTLPIVDERSILAVALAPDGQSALTGSRENLKRWNLKTGKETLLYGEKDKTAATMLVYLPGGKRFLAGLAGGETRLYDVDNEKHLRTFKSKGEHQFVWHLAPSADGKRFVSADFQSSASLWETDTGKELGTLRIEKRTVEEIITGVALAADAKTVYLTWGKGGPEPDDFACTKVYAWDGLADKVLWSALAGYRGRVPMLAKGNALQIGGGPNAFDVWDIERGKRADTWGGHKGTVNIVAALPNGDVISGGQEGVLMTWRKGQLVQREPAHTGVIAAFAMHKKGATWLTAGADLLIRRWPLDPMHTMTFEKKHTGPITSLANCASGAWAASGSGDRTVRTWTAASGKEIASLTGHSEGVNAVAISPDERWIASGSDDQSIRVWPVKDGKLDPDRDVIVLEDHKKPVTCLAFSADGKTLVSGSQDQSLKTWDWAKGKRTRTLTGHKNWLTSVTIVDDKAALTTCDDLTVCLWDLESGKELGRIDFGAVGDCPRCLARLGNDRIVIGTSSWMIYEFQMLPGKTKSDPGSSK